MRTAEQVMCERGELERGVSEAGVVLAMARAVGGICRINVDGFNFSAG